jgi:hypothetical protein
MQHAHKHYGAEKVVTASIPHASADMNVTPLIDFTCWRFGWQFSCQRLQLAARRDRRISGTWR